MATQLQTLIEEVKQENLTKGELENLYARLTHIYSLAHMETSDKEKLEAVYFLNHTEKNDVSARRKFSGSPDGLRLIELKHVIKSLEKLLSSVKHRLFNSY